MRYADGSTYVGKWLNDKREDENGVLTWLEEGGETSKYEGSFKEDKRTGAGIYT